MRSAHLSATRVLVASPDTQGPARGGYMYCTSTLYHTVYYVFVGQE